MTVLRNTFISLCMYFSFTGVSPAAIIDHGDYLTDTATGLDWLDVTETVNMSFDTITGMLGAGGAYSGWRYATGDEFNTLVGNYTGVPITAGFYGMVIQEPDRIDGLVAMLGSTIDAAYLASHGMTWDAYYGYAEGAGLDYTSGFIADAAYPDMAWYATLYDADVYESSLDADYSWAHYDEPVPTYLDMDSVGSYLVRPAITVPEPGVIGLLALGLVGLVATRRRIHRRS